LCKKNVKKRSGIEMPNTRLRTNRCALRLSPKIFRQFLQVNFLIVLDFWWQ
jgi:hypothetical protein